MHAATGHTILWSSFSLTRKYTWCKVVPRASTDVSTIIYYYQQEHITRVTLCVAVLAQRATMPISFPLRDWYWLEYTLDIEHEQACKHSCVCAKVRSRDNRVVHLVCAAALATKRGPLCRQSWNNEANNRPIDRPHLATSLPSATGRTTLGQEGVIIFGRVNIDLPGKHSPAEL